MTQKENQLLLTDLCPRLPYEVKGHRIWVAPLSGSPEECDTELDTFDIECLSSLFVCGKAICKIDGHVKVIEKYSFKPYLRPMSSMTEEEFTELKNYTELKYDQLELVNWDNTHRTIEFYLEEIPHYCVIKVFDWLNAHHFDYRGLIEKGLALEAPKGMYNIKEQ